jgi:uncharacterized lipoprotein YbaY
MTSQARWSVLAAVAVSAMSAGHALAVDPQQGGLGPQYTNPALSNPGSSIPIGRDRTYIPQATQRYVVPDPIRIAAPDYANPAVRVAPISSISPTSPNLTPNHQPRWRLGVYSKDTETGVRIVQVVSGSAAARAGLEAEDTIITVNGYQVGYINGQLYDCASEFERSATTDGWVRILVQNNRNGQLMNLPVKLESRSSKLTGYITLNNRIGIPSDAYAVVELQEIMRPGAPPIPLARQQIQRLTQHPIGFEIEFDPQQIDTRRSYVLTASVLSNRQTLYACRTPTQVLVSGQPQTVSIACDRLAANPGGPIGPYGQDATLEQVVELFREYLERDPSRLELTTWQAELDRGGSLADVRTDLFAQNQFFNQCDRDERVYIERLHELMLGRKPTPEELAYWSRRYEETGGVRRDLAREFIESVSQPN